MAAAIDLTGRKFGKLTAIKPTSDRYSGQVVWECLCDCGETTVVGAGYLSKGRRKHCGCEPKATAADLSGERFGFLVAIKPDRAARKKCLHWLCRCDCGVEKSVSARNLVSGGTASCGDRSHRQRSMGTREY